LHAKRQFFLAPFYSPSMAWHSPVTLLDRHPSSMAILSKFHGTGIRIFGIDAPESDQLYRDEDGEQYRCGQKASNALFDFIDGRPVECVEVDRDRWKRAVSVCTVGGTDIADWLVRNGLALDWPKYWPKYSKGGYADAQTEAKREQRGMWAGSFIEPWNYRACKRSGGRLQSCSDD
jgi:endonuclease YncB( thermonuclease family)